MSAFDEWAAGEGRDVVDLLTVPDLWLDENGQAADALDFRLRQAFQAGATAAIAHRARILEEVDAATPTFHGTATPIPFAHFAAGPWIPGEPPEECKNQEPVLVADAAGWVSLVRWNPEIRENANYSGGWDNAEGGVYPEDIAFHARIKSPKDQAREGPSVPGDRKPKRTIAVDFDGVLHSYITPWQGAEIIPDEPVPGAVDWLNTISKRLDIVIHTTRGRSISGQVAVRSWLVRHGWAGGEFVLVTAEKVPALVYLDDRALRFTGANWPTADEVYSARPWNRPEPRGGEG